MRSTFLFLTSSDKDLTDKVTIVNMKVAQDPAALDLVHQVLLSWRKKQIEMLSKYKTSSVRSSLIPNICLKEGR